MVHGLIQQPIATGSLISHTIMDKIITTMDMA